MLSSHAAGGSGGGSSHSSDAASVPNNPHPSTDTRRCTQQYIEFYCRKACNVTTAMDDPTKVVVQGKPGAEYCALYEGDVARPLPSCPSTISSDIAHRMSGWNRLCIANAHANHLSGRMTQPQCGLILFTHIPKTGGSSVSEVLKRLPGGWLDLSHSVGYTRFFASYGRLFGSHGALGTRWHSALNWRQSRMFLQFHTDGGVTWQTTRRDARSATAAERATTSIAWRSGICPPRTTAPSSSSRASRCPCLGAWRPPSRSSRRCR